MAAAQAAAALAVVVALLAAHGVRAQDDPELNHTSSGAARQLRGSGGGWLPAKATWYGAPNGAGPDDNGGACGFKGTNQYPFMSMTSCGNQPLFNDGQGCGACYQVKCTNKNNRYCSGQPKTVMITDMNYYPVARHHFDLSGTAFGSLAWPGQNDQLRHAGIIDIQFRRVPCDNRGLTISFHVEQGSNPVYIALLVQYANKEGTVSQMDLLESGSSYWTPMRRSWGSVWRLDSNHPLRAPFSIRVRGETWRSVTAYNVIPANWWPGAIYRSSVQY